MSYLSGSRTYRLDKRIKPHYSARYTLFTTLLFSVLLSSTRATSDSVLTLAEAQQRALKSGFESRAAMYHDQARTWERRNTIAGYFPSVSFGLDYLATDPGLVDAASQQFGTSSSFLDILRVVPGLLDLGQSETDTFTSRLDNMQSMPSDFSFPQQVFDHLLTPSLVLQQPLSNGGAELFALTIAAHSKKTAMYDLAYTRQRVVLATRKAYFSALSARERVRVSEDDYAWTQKNLERATIRFNAGSGNKSDVLLWQAQAAQKESELWQAQANARIARTTLFQALGTSPADTDTGVKLETIAAFEAWYAHGMNPMNGTIENSPQYKLLNESLSITRLSTASNIVAFLPKVNAFFSYQWPYGYVDADGFTTHRERTGWTAGVQATVPLFSGFRNTIRYTHEKKNFAQAGVEHQSAVAGLQSNLERIQLFYRAAYKGVEAAEKQRTYLTENLSIMEQRYHGGLAGQIELLEIDLRVRVAEMAYIEKLLECLFLESEYFQATGTLTVDAGYNHH